jgi:hypothetical protein
MFSIRSGTHIEYKSPIILLTQSKCNIYSTRQLVEQTNKPLY